MPEKVVTRFAPSPTGYLHVGGARTAIFNWLFARRTGGTFILRIEDTDIKRNTPTATQQVIDDLRWLGIDWDQGPEVDGPNGPYFQSQRKDIYDKYIKQLIDQKKAYYCFETPQQLQQMRQKAEAQKKGFIYPRPDNYPGQSDVKKAKAQGLPITVRFAMPDTEITVKDIVRGDVKFAPGELGDFIIQKSDGFPTYHFACVVDDELMEVTHVIRGQEHLMNTPAHLALQNALAFRTPLYAHMPVTVSETGGKLSKRERPKTLLQTIKTKQDTNLEKLAAAAQTTTEQINSFISGKSTPDMPAIDAMAEYLGVNLPEINIVDFLKSGYLPETMVNFLALLGWNPGTGREVMPLAELIESFDLDRITKANSLFDRKKLLAFNTEHIKMLSEKKLLNHYKNYLKIVGSPAAAAGDKLLAKIIKLCEGARTLADIERKSKFLFIADDQITYDDKAVKKVLLKNDGLNILQTLRDQIAGLEPFNEQTIENMLRDLAEQKQLGLGKVAQPLRVAICGTTISTPIFDSVSMLGKDKTLKRTNNTLKKFGT